MKLTKFIAITIIISVTCASPPNDTDQPLIWQELQPGEFNVGFQAAAVPIDSSDYEDLTIHGDLQIGFWYPSNGSNENQMMVRDYINLKAWERMDIPKNQEAVDSTFRNFKEFHLKNRVDPRDFEMLSQQSTISYYNAPLYKEQKFPLVVIASGRSGSLFNHFILAEYLASYGFVVVSAPSILQISTKPKDLVQEYLEVMSIMIDEASRQFPVEENNVGLIGYSLCGACVSLFHDTVRPVNAVLSLDGWDGWSGGTKYLRNNLTRPAIEMDISFAYLAEDPSLVERNSPGEWDHSIVSELAAAGTGLLTYFKDLRHIDFTSYALLEFTASNFSYDGLQQIQVEDSEPIELIFEMTRLFMSQNLKKDKNFREELCDKLYKAEKQKIIIETAIDNFCIK